MRADGAEYTAARARGVAGALTFTLLLESTTMNSHPSYKGMNQKHNNWTMRQDSHRISEGKECDLSTQEGPAKEGMILISTK